MVANTYLKGRLKLFTKRNLSTKKQSQEELLQLDRLRVRNYDEFKFGHLRSVLFNVST